TLTPRAYRPAPAGPATPTGGQLRPARRARSTAPGSTATTASMSAAVEVCPSVNRREPRASGSSTPMASSTCEGGAPPAEQADPVEQAMPSASSSSSSASPSQPGKEKCALPGSRSVGSPWYTASGTAARTRSTSWSRSPRSRSASSCCCLTAISTASANRSEEHTSELQSRENLVCRLLLEKKN